MVASLPGSSGRMGTTPVSGSSVIATTGFVFAAQYFAGADNPASPTAATVLASSGTIPTTQGVQRVAPAAAVTGVILAPGTQPGQEVTVINEAAAANTVTFAAAGTSNVADGTSDVIAGLICRQFVWDAATQLWYRAA